MLDKAASYQLGQARAARGQRHSTNVSGITTTPAPTEFREVGGSNTSSTQPGANTHMAYASPPSMREIGNAGLVRPTNGLGFEPDFVDCPSCRRRTKTVVKRVPSETTRQLRFSYAMGSFPLLGACGLIPDCMEMAYNTEHACSACQWKLAVMQHDHIPGNVAYVPSIYSTET